jgi:hypothetical protein
MKKDKPPVEYWSIMVQTPEGRYEDIKVFACDANNATEAKAQARQYGKVINCTPIHMHV